MNSLKYWREKRDLTLAQLARSSGIGRSTINNFENGRTNLSPEKLKQLASSLKTTPDEILKDRDVETVATLKDEKSNATPFKAQLRFVPVISLASAGAAHDYADMESQIDLMIETNSRDGNAFALIIEGDSMLPRFEAGDIVIFEPNSQPRNGDIVVARMVKDNGVLFKKFRRIGAEGKTIRLESLNPDYKTVELPETDFRFIYPAVEFKGSIRRKP